jgi:hypothetical protein
VNITEKDNATEHLDLTPVAGKESNLDHLGEANPSQEQIVDNQVKSKQSVGEREIADSFNRAQEITKSNLGVDAVTT